MHDGRIGAEFPPPIRQTAPVPNRVLIVGDSLAIGAAEVVGNEAVRFVEPAYPDVMRTLLPDVDIIVDCGINRMSSTVCERLGELLRIHRPAVLLVAVGGNDADCDWRRFVMSDGAIVRNRVKLEVCQANLRAIVRQAHASGAHPILVEPTNSFLAVRGIYLSRLSGRDVNAMIAAKGGQPENDRRLAEYRQGIAQVAAETAADLVTCPIDFAEHDPHEVLCEDGTHFSAAGQRLLATAFAAAVTSALAAAHSIA